MNFLVNSLISDAALEALRQQDGGRSAWKFVIIDRPDVRHFVCGPISRFPYHANLVGRWCNQYEIGAIWGRRPDLVEILDTDIQIRGGGQIKLDLGSERLKIYGRSTAYGPYQPEHLECLPDSNAFFREYDLEIEGL